LKEISGMKFYRCPHCGNIVVKLTDGGPDVVCCGQPMELLKADSIDASLEKHVPVVEMEKGQVSVFVGHAEHPMTQEHHIEWIVLETDKGWDYRKLTPGNKPHAVFAVAEGESVRTAYAYCNLHGLWKKDI